MTATEGMASTISGTSKYEVPGSNLYLSTWISLLSSCAIAFNWKAAKALKFAKAKQEKCIVQSDDDDKQNVDDDDAI